MIAILVCLLPFISSILSIILLVAYSNSNRCASYISSLLISITSILALWILYQYNDIIHIHCMDWIYGMSWSIYIDRLSAVMLLVITSISALVHIYSIGYMVNDNSQHRFFSYLSLFTFFMILLVVSDNFLQMFVGWEGVGVCSYLLIGFWHHKESANHAAMKAFLVNRVADIAMVMAFCVMLYLCNSLNYNDVFSMPDQLHLINLMIFGEIIPAIDIICIMLLIGAMGKSAQIGFHVWLPDAMEGPTPVSALIHAATMVTAGIFLLARCSPLFEYSQIALSIIIVVGCLTAVMAGIIALFQNDIKKIVAYSTCSQLGYMFFACGISGYGVAIFHLVTHACFKALLFLSAGAVITGMNHEQDIRKMGGLYRKMPMVYIAFWVGSLAIAGIFPFAGYYSKDLILLSAISNQYDIVFWVGVFGALLTALYSFRLIFLVFHGKGSGAKIKPVGMSMMIPVLILAIGSIISGMAINEITIEALLKGSLITHHIDHIEWAVIVPLAFSIFGILLCYILYRMGWFFKLGPSIFENKFYFDEIYNICFVRAIKLLSLISYRVIDSLYIDGIANGLASITGNISRFFSNLQTGAIYHYNFVMMIGVLIILLWLNIL